MTLDVTVTVKGLDKAVNLITKIPSALDTAMGRAIREMLGWFAGDLAEYPSAIPGSSYRRTGQLGQRWAGASKDVRQLSGHRFSGRMSNTRPGAVYVQSQSEQAAVHRGRWRTADRVVESRLSEVEELVRQAGQSAVGEGV